MATPAKTFKRLAKLPCLADGSKLTTAEFRNVTYDVIPIMALKADIVIRPMGSSVAEYVPGVVLAASLHKIANSPVVLDHPVNDDGDAVSANDISVLEASQLGYNFDPSYDDGWIINVYLNDALAADVDAARGDTEASDVIADLRAGKSREVSVGVHVYVEEVDNGVTRNGIEYGAVWLSIDDFDHLAILNSTSLGACSNSDGCGPMFDVAVDVVDAVNVPTISPASTTSTTSTISKPLLRAANDTQGTKPAMKMSKTKWKARNAIRSLMLDGEPSDSDIYSRLYGALRTDGDWDTYIKSLYSKQKKFVYESWEDGGYRTFLRSYTIKDEEYTLKDDRAEVIGFSPVVKNAAGGVDDIDVTGLGIDNVVNSEVDNTDDADTGDDTMTVSKELKAAVDKVINCSKCPFDETDREFLQGKDEKWLANVSVKFAGIDTDTDADEVVDTSASTTALTDTPDGVIASDTVTREEYDNLAKELRDARPFVNAYKANQAAERKSLIEGLTKAQPENYTEAFFTRMSNDQIRTISTSLGLSQLAAVPALATDITADYSLASGGSNTDGNANTRTKVPRALDKLRKPSKQAAVTTAVN